jgi:hypothetical protein
MRKCKGKRFCLTLAPNPIPNLTLSLQASLAFVPVGLRQTYGQDKDGVTRPEPSRRLQHLPRIIYPSNPCEKSEFSSRSD